MKDSHPVTLNYTAEQTKQLEERAWDKGFWWGAAAGIAQCVTTWLIVRLL